MKQAILTLDDIQIGNLFTIIGTDESEIYLKTNMIDRKNSNVYCCKLKSGFVEALPEGLPVTLKENLLDSIL